MSTENSTDLVQYAPKNQPFLPALPGNLRYPVEEQLSSQERTIAVLLEQAFRIKEEISSCLQGSHGFQREESMARQLLENHIQTITSIVKKLNQNIQVLEEQIRVRDNAITESHFASQTFTQAQLHGMGDLRGRVARCDASLAKLSGDINVIRHEYQKVEKDIQALRSILEAFSKTVDVKVMQLLGRIDSYGMEQTSNLKAVQGDNNHELSLLNFKFDALKNELREQVQNQQKWTENQLMKSEKEQLLHINQFLSTIKEKMEESKNKLERKVQELIMKSEELLNPQRLEIELNKVKFAENKLYKRMNRMEKQIWEELNKIQNEYQSGFQSIRESLESLQQIQTTKIQLEKYKFRKDISKLHRKIVELQEM
ncbi:protein FAM81B isoform X1 [Sarcophilus harrisii]|uniref:Family with sequence similarity 81 member B n=1 Tax=Sarcophilus harrisii TaxID=9305 RepID=G3WIS2_SARHA|nr:protein FAM81B isoform X1 [Sarcophilus harrisii]XP_031823495.1 protein FAM81B isoform X1 [Sarcophilus harrisii]